MAPHADDPSACGDAAPRAVSRAVDPAAGRRHHRRGDRGRPSASAGAIRSGRDRPWHSSPTATSSPRPPMAGSPRPRRARRCPMEPRLVEAWRSDGLLVGSEHGRPGVTLGGRPRRLEPCARHGRRTFASPPASRRQLVAGRPAGILVRRRRPVRRERGRDGPAPDRPADASTDRPRLVARWHADRYTGQPLGNPTTDVQLGDHDHGRYRHRGHPGRRRLGRSPT